MKDKHTPRASFRAGFVRIDFTGLVSLILVAFVAGTVFGVLLNKDGRITALLNRNTVGDPPPEMTREGLLDKRFQVWFLRRESREKKEKILSDMVYPERLLVNEKNKPSPSAERVSTQTTTQTAPRAMRKRMALTPTLERK